MKKLKIQQRKNKVTIVKIIEFFDVFLDKFSSFSYYVKKWHPAKTVVQVQDLKSGKIFNVYENQLKIVTKHINDNLSVCCLLYDYET